MKDSYRVLQKNGYLFLASFLEVKNVSDHIFLKYFKTVFAENGIIDFIKEEEMISDLKLVLQTESGIEIIKEEGMIVGWWKK